MDDSVIVRSKNSRMLLHSLLRRLQQRHQYFPCSNKLKQRMRMVLTKDPPRLPPTPSSEEPKPPKVSPNENNRC